MIDKLSAFFRDGDVRLEGRQYTNGITQIEAINEIIKAFDSGEHIVILKGGTGSGKTSCEGTLVLMSDGSWKDVSEIKVGDRVISPQEDGTTTTETVTTTHTRWEEDIYSIQQKIYKKNQYRELYRCAGNHDIPLHCRILRKKKGKVDYSHREFAYKVFEARELWKKKPCWWQKSRYGFTSPLIESFGNKKKLFDPYFLGLSAEKFIPKEYLLSDSDDRVKLMAGLLDTDGYISKTQDISYTTKSRQLADDIIFLVRSLGGRAELVTTMKSCQSFDEKRPYQKVGIRFNIEERRLIQKYMKNRFKKNRMLSKPNKNVRHFRPYIVKTPAEQVYGFEITGKSHWYITNHFVVSHNSLVGLEVARNYGSGYITVPRIFHQEQYKKDYSDDDSRIYLRDKAGNPMGVVTLKGKNNFECAKFADGTMANDSDLPCNDSKANVPEKIQRCDGYFPVTPVTLDSTTPDITYQAVKGEWGFSKPSMGKIIDCPYYDQIKDTIRTPIVIINAKKLEIECAIGRLPQKAVLIVDESDNFLKEVASPKAISITKARDACNDALEHTRNMSIHERDILGELFNLLDSLIKDRTTTSQKGFLDLESSWRNKTFMLHDDDKLTGIATLLTETDCAFLQNHSGIKPLYDAFIWNFTKVSDQHFYYELKSKRIVLNSFSLDASQVVMGIFGAFPRVLLMSATHQKDDILSEFYGINRYKEVRTEETIVGTLFNTTLGCEVSFSGKAGNAFDPEVRRKRLHATGEIVLRTQKYQQTPLKRLFHISAFGMLPRMDELHYHEGLIELGTIEEDDKELDRFEHFRNGTKWLHKSTKMFRAIDLPDDGCRVVIFQKLPFPFMSLYYHALAKVYGENFVWDVMWDECERELIQGSARGIRHQHDWCLVVSPDIRVSQRISRIFMGNRRVTKLHYPNGNLRRR